MREDLEGEAIEWQREEGIDMLPDISRLKFNAEKHYYTLDDDKKLTGVTQVIDGTSSKANLINWAANCAVDYVVDWSWTGEAMESNPPRLRKVLEEARTAHTRKKEKAGSKGTDSHALVETYINFCLESGGKPVPVEVENAKVYHPSVKPFSDWATENVDYFISAEQKLFSDKKRFAGTCDFVAVIGGKLTIGDLKTFPKMWSPDAFVQMGAYSYMYNELTGHQPEQSVVVKMCDPEDERLKKYGGKAFAVYPRYSIKEDEDMFLKRLEIYRYNQAFTSPKE